MSKKFRVYFGLLWSQSRCQHHKNKREKRDPDRKVAQKEEEDEKEEEQEEKGPMGDEKGDQEGMEEKEKAASFPQEGGGWNKGERRRVEEEREC